MGKTYGQYNMLWNDTSNFANQFGSGGNAVNASGGGRIVLVSNSLTLNGRIDANGLPPEEDLTSPTDVCNFYLLLFSDGGSGGYIYIGYLGANPQNYSNSSALLINSPILAQGGKGKGKQGSSGSGGRIVFDIDPNVLDPLPLMSVSGGVQTQSQGKLKYFLRNLACQSGASGTIYSIN